MTGVRAETPGRRSGFTLLEVLVALAILGIAIASVLQLMGGSARAAERTRTTTEAVFAAVDLMEEMYALSESALRTRAGESGDYAEHERRLGRMREGGGMAVARGPEPRPFTYALNVVADHQQAGAYRVTVRVAWPGARGTAVELATLRRFPEPEEESLQ
jgi:type II secretion system protein I